VPATDEEAPPKPVRAPTTTGGEGQLTAAVTRADATPLLGADRASVVVEAQGTRLEYELISLLRRTGNRFRRFTVGTGSDLADRSLGSATVRETHGVAVLAVRRSTGWEIAPPDALELAAGDELFAVGSRDALEAFAGVVA
jgi:uncharacterized protein with PhoU and TrkA domain